MPALTPRPLLGITGIEKQDSTCNNANDAGDDNGNDDTGIDDAGDDNEEPIDGEMPDGNDLFEDNELLFHEARLAGFTTGEADLYIRERTARGTCHTQSPKNSKYEADLCEDFWNEIGFPKGS